LSSSSSWFSSMSSWGWSSANAASTVEHMMLTTCNFYASFIKKTPNRT
jgi:hypothetical protein